MRLTRLIRPRLRRNLNALAMGNRDEERGSRLVGGPSRTATPLQRLLPAKAATISSKTSSSRAGSPAASDRRSPAPVVSSPCEQPALLVFLNTIQVTRTPHVFFFAPCSPDDRIAMALLSAARSTSPPPILEADLRTGRGGVAQLGVSAMVVLLLFALLVRSAASAPGFRSGFRSGLGCASFGRWARPCVRGATRAGSAASRRRWW